MSVANGIHGCANAGSIRGSAAKTNSRIDAVYSADAPAPSNGRSNHPATAGAHRKTSTYTAVKITTGSLAAWVYDPPTSATITLSVASAAAP